MAGRNGSRRDPLTEITRAQVDIYGGEQIRPPDKVNSLSLSPSLSRSGPERAFPSCLCACTISCELELIGGRTEENQIDRSTVYVRPRINPSTIRSIPGRRRWPIRLPGQFPPIIRSPPSCFATMYTGKFIVCPANGRSTRERVRERGSLGVLADSNFE